MNSKIYRNGIYKYDTCQNEQGKLMWQTKNPASGTIGNIRNGVAKHPSDNYIYFPETAGREDLNGYAPDMTEFSHVRFSEEDMCGVVVKIKITDDINTSDTARVFAFSLHFWWFDKIWHFVSPATIGVKLKTYAAGQLRRMTPDNDGYITLVNVIDIKDMLSGSSNYDSNTASAISLNIRIDRIKEGDTRGEKLDLEVAPNEINNITFRLNYIGVYSGDMSHLESKYEPNCVHSASLSS